MPFLFLTEAESLGKKDWNFVSEPLASLLEQETQPYLCAPLSLEILVQNIFITHLWVSTWKSFRRASILWLLFKLLMPSFSWEMHLVHHSSISPPVFRMSSHRDTVTLSRSMLPSIFSDTFQDSRMHQHHSQIHFRYLCFTASCETSASEILNKHR